MLPNPPPPTAPDPDDFVDVIDNPYFSLTPGTTRIYEGETDEGTERVEFKVTGNTVEIMGVTCIEVVDTVTLDGELIERTRDWFAQDEDGNVWYFGEASRDYENGEVVSTQGSWVAGEDGALPGIVMLADPDEGDEYAQEFAPGVAEDRAIVLSDEVSRAVAYGDFDEVLKTRDFTPLEPGKFEHKYYVAGIGQILTTNPNEGTQAELIQIRYEGGGGGDTIAGNVGGDDLRGFDGDDRLWGRGGGDVIFGGKGKDDLRGEYDDDRLLGGHGADKLDGGTGDDTLIGGAGGDTFVFRGLNDEIVQRDVISDYRLAAGDGIDLPNAACIASETFAGGVWRLIFKGDGDTLVIHGATDANGDGHIADDLLIV